MGHENGRHQAFDYDRSTEDRRFSLEDEFWYGLLEIAVYEQMTVPTLVKRIDHRRKTVNLSSAIRIFVFKYFKSHDGKRKV